MKPRKDLDELFVNLFTVVFASVLSIALIGVVIYNIVVNGIA